MPFDRDALADAVAVHGTVARIVLVHVKGSAPRPAGTSMLVWPGGSSGTIGGGQLELQSMKTAAAMLQSGPTIKIARTALGPSLNQCCGGAVTVVTEVFDSQRLEELQSDFPGIYLRQVEADAPALPATLRAKLRRANSADVPLSITLQDGWLAEAMWHPSRQVMIYGAGHVGSALARILAPLPQFRTVLADPRAGYLNNFPVVITTVAGPWATALAQAEPEAAHFIMTPAHDQDLELCHLLLNRDFAFGGLIGSDTKWARFRSRLAGLGHPPEQIAKITCPIGDRSLGKHPQAIALGVATQLLHFVPVHRNKPARMDEKERSA